MLSSLNGNAVLLSGTEVTACVEYPSMTNVDVKAMLGYVAVKLLKML